jgi:hypothetical protein
MEPPDPVVTNLPPIYKSPPMPAPPHTCKAPVLVEVAEVVLDITKVVVVPVVAPALPAA